MLLIEFTVGANRSKRPVAELAVDSGSSSRGGNRRDWRSATLPTGRHRRDLRKSISLRWAAITSNLGSLPALTRPGGNVTGINLISV